MAGVRVAGVSKRYGATQALRPLDLHVEDGELLALLGPSGSGKTTLLRLIAGFIEPSSGAIEIGGRDVSRLPPHRRNLGVVFQSYALFPHLTVHENVGFGLRMRGIARADAERRTAEALQTVGLAGLQERRPAQLSGGQQQRVALARAIVIKPDVLLLDEPLGALDLELRRRMQIEIKELHAQLGRTFIYVTHDQEEALTMADRVAVMKDGQIVQIGPPREVYGKPTSRFVARFLGGGNLLAGRVRDEGAAGLGLHCAAGVLPLPPGAAPEGVETVAAIRPERLRVGARASGCPHIFSAALRSVAFRGATRALQLELQDGSLLEAVDLGCEAADGVLSPGTDILVGLDPADLSLVGEP